MGRSLQRVGGTLQTVGTGLTPLTHTRQYMCHHSNCGLQPLSTILWLPATSLPGCTAALLHTVNIPYSQFRGKLRSRLQAPGRPGYTLGPAHFSPARWQKSILTSLTFEKFSSPTQILILIQTGVRAYSARKFKVGGCKEDQCSVKGS